MKNPITSCNLIRMAIVSLFALMLSFTAAAAEFKEGVHYERVAVPQPVRTGEKIEVLELFWYKCPHCYSLEPSVHEWLQNKPEIAEYVPLPAVLSQGWTFHARAFYTFEALGMLEELHGAFFTAIHKERKRLTNKNDLAEWAATQGADANDVKQAFDSFAVDTKTRQARQASGKYGITGVPAIVVGGKYRTSVRMAGGEKQVFELVNFLVEKAQSERGS